jgi:two-component system OmpR family response regulator
VTTVGDGPSALAFIKNNPDSVDLVILDLMLPGMSGYAVCESLRGENQPMPIMILSARTLAEDRARGFDVGADQYLTKPFDLDELLSRVKGLLKRHGSRAALEAKQPAPIHVFDFAENQIDFDAFQATVRGRAVRLTQLEMRLLRYFVENEGRIIPRRELLENVWEMPGYLSTRAPDQFIRRLRKIFEPDPANPRFFLTIRDGGYRFVAKGEDG